MAEIRVSAHNFEIERGRKNKPKSVPVNERFCRNYNTLVEDEVFFTSDCPIYEQLRNEYLPRRHPDAYFINLIKNQIQWIRKPCHIYQTRYDTEKRKKYIKTKRFLSFLVEIHTYRRQPHHALICVYIYHACYVFYFIYYCFLCIPKLCTALYGINWLIAWLIWHVLSINIWCLLVAWCGMIQCTGQMKWLASTIHK